MFVEQLKEKDVAELINTIKEATNQKDKTEESDVQMDFIQHGDGTNYMFVKTKNFIKCWLSDFTCATRIFDASHIYRVFMGRKFGQKYIDSLRNYRIKKEDEKIENEMKHFESILKM